VRSEPLDTIEVYKYNGVVEIFTRAVWMGYFEKLQGFDESVALEFALTLQEGEATVRGIKIPITTEILARVTGLEEEGEAWFERRKPFASLREEFVHGTREILIGDNKGIQRGSLEEPWRHVAFIIQKFLTYEGRFELLFGYHLRLSIHLRHQRCVNMSYFLLHSLKLMSSKAKGSLTPETNITHHGLIKLIVKDALLNTKWTWLTLVEGILEIAEEIENEGEVEGA